MLPVDRAHHHRLQAFVEVIKWQNQYSDIPKTILMLIYPFHVEATALSLPVLKCIECNALTGIELTYEPYIALHKTGMVKTTLELQTC